MPVSKKRKKDGKPVRRHEEPAVAGEHPHGPEAKPEVLPEKRAAPPRNPFVAQQQSKRGAQRGR
jgi:hypothetical protein